MGRLIVIQLFKKYSIDLDPKSDLCDCNRPILNIMLRHFNVVYISEPFFFGG
jgi:hypothetical protein